MKYLTGIVFAVMTFISCASADSITIASETYQKGSALNDRLLIYQSFLLTRACSK